MRILGVSKGERGWLDRCDGMYITLAAKERFEARLRPKVARKRGLADVPLAL